MDRMDMDFMDPIATPIPKLKPKNRSYIIKTRTIGQTKLEN